MAGSWADGRPRSLLWGSSVRSGSWRGGQPPSFGRRGGVGALSLVLSRAFFCSCCSLVAYSVGWGGREPPFCIARSSACPLPLLPVLAKQGGVEGLPLPLPLLAEPLTARPSLQSPFLLTATRASSKVSAEGSEL